MPLTSNLTALACRARVAREYSNMHTRVLTRVLAHAHAGTRTSTREYSNTHAFTLERVHEIHAQWTRQPRTQALHFLSGSEKPGYRRYRYAFACTACAHYLRAHACDTHCTRVRSNIIRTRVARVSHACGFRVTREWTHVDRQVARERHCLSDSMTALVSVTGPDNI